MELARRKSQRLKDFDYSETRSYFLTICCENARHFLGKIRKYDQIDTFVGGGVLDAPKAESLMELSEYGKCVENKLEEMRASGIYNIDNYVIMPNHIHLLLSIRSASGASRTPPPTKHDATFDRANEAIPRFVSYFKRSTNKMCGIYIWQRGYHDHVIRDSGDYESHWTYIDNNPYRWAEDEYFN